MLEPTYSTLEILHMIRVTDDVDTARIIEYVVLDEQLRYYPHELKQIKTAFTARIIFLNETRNNHE